MGGYGTFGGFREKSSSIVDLTCNSQFSAVSKTENSHLQLLQGQKFLASIAYTSQCAISARGSCIAVTMDKRLQL